MVKQEALESFIDRIGDFSSLTGKEQVDYLAFYLLAIEKRDEFTPKDIDACFKKIDIPPYARTAPYLSEETSKRGGNYVRPSDKGYRLERSVWEKIRTKLSQEPQKIKIEQELLDLLPKIQDGNKRAFLEEAILCLRVGAPRAAVIMTWSLAIYHMHDFVFTNKLADFQTALTKDSDKRASSLKINSADDFSELKESKFIELLRSSGVISNDVRKILDEKLGIRNSAGHPSRVVLSPHKATEFILDLVENIVRKY